MGGRPIGVGSFKASAQVSPRLRANYTLFRGDKQKFGRGAGPDRADESTHDQSGPTTLHKVGPALIPPCDSTLWQWAHTLVK